MTKIDVTETEATAAATGLSATNVFRTSGKLGSAVGNVERTDRLARKVIAAVLNIVAEEKVTYAEYNALKAWLIRVGDDGEWPLFLDVFIEHAVEEVASAHREGSKGTIEGPFYVPDAPRQQSPAVLKMRQDEAGTPLTFQGQVAAVDGQPLPNAIVELWHADDLGFYSQFAPGIDPWNLRGTFSVDAAGRFQVQTVQPAPYMIPTDGACGQLISAAGWSPWRPAHLHLKVTAPGYELLTTQLYFDGGDHLKDDVAQAVKPELVLHPTPRDDGHGDEVTYDFVLDPIA